MPDGQPVAVPDILRFKVRWVDCTGTRSHSNPNALVVLAYCAPEQLAAIEADPAYGPGAILAVEDEQ